MKLKTAKTVLQTTQQKKVTVLDNQSLFTVSITGQY